MDIEDGFLIAGSILGSLPMGKLSTIVVANIILYSLRFWEAKASYLLNSSSVTSALRFLRLSTEMSLGRGISSPCSSITCWI